MLKTKYVSLSELVMGDRVISSPSETINLLFSSDIQNSVSKDQQAYNFFLIYFSISTKL